MSGDWQARLAARAPMHVLITGGSGTLGVRLAQLLQHAGHRVTVLDVAPPRGLDVGFVQGDVRRSPAAFAGVDAVVHLAGVHGVHLVRGASRETFWAVNVRGTAAVLAAAAAAGVETVVLASSTSVYGPGSDTGPARVLDEATRVWPENAHELSKVAAEQLVHDAREDGMRAVSLRFGRFFFASAVDYQLRKLSTGVDARDVCQAIALVLCAAEIPHGRYCVASDLPLPRADREQLGVDLPGVLARTYPDVVAAAAARGVELPSRVGKSVSSDRLRSDLGYAPERSLAWAAELWRAGDRLLRAPAVLTSSAHQDEIWPVAT